MDNMFGPQQSANTNTAMFGPSQPSSQGTAIPMFGPSSNSTTVPLDVQNGLSQLGNQDENGWCEAWQEQMSGSPKMGLTAQDAWDNYQAKGLATQDLSTARAGDLIYFAGDGGLGHTGIITKVSPNNGIDFVSATDNGVQNNNVSQWTQSTGQQILGIVPR